MSLNTKSSHQAHSTLIHRRPVPETASLLHDDPLVHQILAARGITDREQLSIHLTSLPPPTMLPNIATAVDRLIEAFVANERIVIVGDYDCDGATSTSVAMLGLAGLGFTHIDYVIPNRMEYGYGLSVPIVEDIVAGKLAAVDSASTTLPPTLIVTVDNGVASVEGVAYAAKHSIDVVITDHHLPPNELPAALALVNPHVASVDTKDDTAVAQASSPQENPVPPGGNLAGVGVIFYVLLALRRAMQDQALGNSFNLAELLDLVAIGTVADVVPLDAINRVLVEQGLRRIRAGQCRPGILSILKTAGRNATELNAVDIGFALGPRLNAAGRIADMRVGVECLLAEDKTTALDLAERLDALNRERRRIESTMQAEAELRLEVMFQAHVALFDAGWHEGVIGILAGRLKERLHRPVVICTASDNTFIKGSARSIPGVHIRDILATIDATAPGLLEKFGGHAMAAGVTLEAHRFDEFAARFDAAVEAALNGRLPVREWLTDGALKPANYTLGMAELLERFLPWGQGFAAPLFDDEFTVLEIRTVGEKHARLRLQPGNSKQSYVAIAFNQADCCVAGDRAQVVFSLHVNTWREQRSLQLQVKYLVPRAAS